MFKVENFNLIKLKDVNLNFGCSSLQFCLLFMLLFLSGNLLPDLSGGDNLEGVYLIFFKIQFINIITSFMITMIYNYPLQKCGIDKINIFKITNIIIYFTSLFSLLLNFVTFISQIQDINAYFICWFLCMIFHVAIMMKCFTFFRHYNNLSKL